MATGNSQTANFDSWLNQATDPNNQEDRWESIQGFYQLVNQEADGPQIAVRLLAHKIQSPQEKEALQALTVLEACMNNCGKKFHSEAAKFRFLNELIKVLTPKYFGAWTPQKVKDRVTEVLYGWTLWLKDEPKIQEAYRMLKTQGIITKDPEVPDTLIMAPPPQRTTDSVFDQEEKAKLLARLLKSGRPEDLETANRLIKSTIKEEQEKAEKAARRESTLKQVESSTKQLRAAMDQHADAATPLQPSDDLKALYEGCERLRPSLFRLASDTVDDDAALAQILAANDELTLAVNAYKERVAPGGRRHANNNHAPSSPIKSYHLIDLSALESTQSGQPAAADSPPPPPSATSLLCDLESSFLGVAEQEEPMEHTETQEPSKSYYEELMQLNGDTEFGGRDVVLRARGCPPNSNGTSMWSQNPPSDSPPLPEEGACPPHLLRDIFVPMETIKPSQLEPITLYDRGGVRVSLHFARDPPPGRPSVAVVVLSTVNTSALHVDHFLFQAAVPKTMSVKLQPASGTCLPPYNPLLPPPAISQVLLLANPQTRQVRLRYKLTLTHGRQHVTESGDISSFPDWSALISR